MPESNGTLFARPAAGDASEIHLVDPERCKPAPGQPPIPESRLYELLENIRQHGQLVPGISYPCPVSPGYFIVGDGNARALCAGILKQKFKTLLLSEEPDEIKLITLRVSTALVRKGADKVFTGADILRLIELTGKTQAEIAEHFGFKSQGQVSKLIAPFVRGIPALIDALRNREIAPKGASFIARLPAATQVELLPRCLGKKCAVIERLCKDAVAGKARVKGARGKCGALAWGFAGESPEAFLAELDKLAKGVKTLIANKWGMALLADVVK